MSLKAIFVTAGLLAVALEAQAQQPMHGHGHARPSTSGGAESPAVAGFKAANEKMHRDMAIPYSGDPDVDFVRSMIPHHQGAIDMAKVALQHAKDEQVRKWANDVIREQEREIAEMQSWLKKKGAL